MKANFLVVAVIILLVGGIWLLGEPDSIKAPNEASSKPAVARSVAQEEPDPETTESQVADIPFGIDPDRLYDKGYEKEPGVRALAKAHGIPPECLIALAKYRFDQVPLESDVCPKPRDALDFPTLAVGMDHPYNQYSNSQLRSLATSSPEAAVILARRLESDAEAREMYERAVALSGIAEPLIEWMTEREIGGLIYRNGELDIEAAKEGYEVLLTAAAFDGTSESTIRMYQEELQREEINLRAVEKKAREEVAKIRRLRQELTGRGQL